MPGFSARIMIWRALAEIHGNISSTRYNGAPFTVFNHANTRELTSQRLKTLSEDRQGNLWISSEEGPLMRYRDGGFPSLTE